MAPRPGLSAGGFRLHIATGGAVAVPPTPLVPDMADTSDSIEALRRSEQRLRLIADSARDTIWSMAPDGRVTYVSPGVTALRGITPEEAMHQRPEEIHPPDSLARSATYFMAMLQAIAEGRTPEPFRGDLEYYRRDGSTCWTEVLAFPILDERGQLVELLGVSRDLADRRAREAAGHAAQRLDAMGRMAWGVSHEVNNALTIIRSASELLARQLAVSPDVQETVATVNGAVGRIAALTSQLLAFSRRRPSNAGVVRVAEQVQQGMGQLETMARPARCRLVVDAEAVDALARLDASLLQESLAVLVRNAAESVGENGEVEVHCTVQELCAMRSTRTRLLMPGHYVCITVADHGAGMSQEAIEHAFEPFHAMRPDGSGLGLGLATVSGLTVQQDGGLTVESTPGEGTRFTLWWPLLTTTAPAAEVSESPAPSAPMLTAPPPSAPLSGVTRRTVLLVDDDALVLRLTARVLQHLGYTVIQAANADEAMARAGEGGIDLLVSDVRMPGTNGFDLVQSLVARGLDLPTLFISGDVGATIPSTWDSRIRPQFLAKPFTTEEIRQRLSVLERAAAM